MKRSGARKRGKILSVEFSKDQWRWLEDESETLGESKGSCVRSAVQSMMEWKTSASDFKKKHKLQK
jgi:hypothetical protein